jgi:hypothetical protein
MKQLIAFSILALVVGCDPTGSGDLDLLSGFLAPQAEIDCSAHSEPTALPQQVPAELLLIQANPPKVEWFNHPLAEVEFGTVIDDLSGLNGCWGRHYFDSFFDQTAGFYEIESWEFLKFDIAAGRAWNFKLRGATPAAVIAATPNSPHAELPFFIVDEFEVSIVDETTLVMAKISGQGAAIDIEGKPVYYCPAAGGSFNLASGDKLNVLVTLQGDFMKYVDVVGIADPLIAELSAEYWERYDCP